MGFFERLDHADPRYIYILVTLAIVAPLLLHVSQRQEPTKPAADLYRTIENMNPSDNKIVILSCDWSPELSAETQPQARAVMRHLFRKKIKFAITSQLVDGGQLSDALVDQVAREFGAVRNVDYTVWGFRPNFYDFILAMMKDIPTTVAHNKEGMRIAQIPMMRGINDYHDVAAVIDFTGYSNFADWTSVSYGRYHVPNALGCTGIIAPDAFPYYDSGQYFGLLAGLKGAAEYESLLNQAGEGTKGMQSQSVVHLLIITLIILGNIAYLLARSRSNRTDAG
jgi:hypothetical protein